MLCLEPFLLPSLGLFFVLYFFAVYGCALVVK